MGTNYYLRTDACDKCGRADHETHIGKSSVGWTFSFHATEEIKDEAAWREAISKGRIFDEYGEEIPFERFWEMVERKRDAPNNHSIEAANNGWSGGYLDNKGNSFSTGEFS